MKFTLIYDGELPSTGNGSKKAETKWAIRKQLHPQLVELWRVHPALIQANANSLFPLEGASLTQAHHTHVGPIRNHPPLPDLPVARPMIHLCEPIERGGRAFLPIVRDTYSLTCSLKILFMRPEPAGRVYQGGDLDNRIKTLLDALSVPLSADHVIDESPDTSMIRCVLEDDRLVTGIDVQTERLLSGAGTSEKYVRLVIEVDVRVRDARIYNQVFLGD